MLAYSGMVSTWDKLYDFIVSVPIQIKAGNYFCDPLHIFKMFL